MSVSGSRLDDSAESAVMFCGQVEDRVLIVDSALALLFVRRALVRIVFRISNKSKKAPSASSTVGELVRFSDCVTSFGRPRIEAPGLWLCAPTSNLLKFDCERRSPRAAAGGY
jgi:hypothetical protein